MQVHARKASTLSKDSQTKALCVVQDYQNRLVEWDVSKAGPGRITLSSQQARLLRDSPGEFQLQVCARAGL